MKNIFKVMNILMAVTIMVAVSACREHLDEVKPDILEASFFRCDGPYLLFNNDKVEILEVLSDNSLRKQEVEVGTTVTLPVLSDMGEHLFDVPVKTVTDFQIPEWRHAKEYESTFIVSDPHGRFDLFAKILKEGGVINDRYEWIYGNNHLVVIGDVFDRGADVLPIFWLIYKLEMEAEKKDGKVSMILGDHEEMIMRNNLKYTFPKYNWLSEKAMGVPYSELWGPNSLLGRWLKSKNTVQVVGENLYVHAGLSRDFVESEVDLGTMNQKVRESIMLSKQERKKQFLEWADFLYGDMGPLWYRGMAKNQGELSVTEEEVDRLLEIYGVKRIFIGHTENVKVTGFYNNKVIDVCVNHPKASKSMKSRAVVIRNGEIGAINDKGEILKL